MRFVVAFAAAAWLLLLPAFSYAGPVLDRVRSAGRLTCASLSEPPDFSKDDTHAGLPALGRDLCRAVAAAVLGDRNKLNVRSYPDERHGFAAVQKGEADLLLESSPQLSAAVLRGVAFGHPVFFDGLGFLIGPGEHVTTLADLAGKRVCYLAGTPTESELQDFLDQRGIAVLPFPVQETVDMTSALAVARCTIAAGSLSQLAVIRAGLPARSGAFKILSDPNVLDPVSPAWQQEDAGWGHIVNAVTDALLAAEQAGIGQADAASAADHADARFAKLLAADRLTAQILGLTPGWSLRVIEAVGNYGELFRRDLGAASALDLPRGPNALWTQGGLLYFLPIR